MLMINRWGYLNIEQAALLTQKSFISAKRILERNLKKVFIKSTNIQEKTFIIFLIKVIPFLGREHKKAIKINCYELPHQDMLIKWLCSKIDIEHYQTERELKMENWKLKAYSNLLIYKSDNSKIYVEFDNTRKSPIRIKNKIINYKDWLNNGNKVHWVSTNKTLSNWTQKIIRELNLFVNKHTYEIWNSKE
ncbi:hypothetical protein [Spiroplasma phoeniceum]|uniref:Uncharacterized protein n=1 Tax=Spiroplasma phoeniceum P40 TaxID=1276259 RepID=A0A345DSN9_9MOLU|nr:hypothetical protein [Spiroplasma phoeniceum]AXF97230.1 hypothetical protein SDAV_003033 [Spiroplasma phoeniceum P40]